MLFILKFEGGEAKLELTPFALTTPPFCDVYENDRSEGKHKALKVFKYVMLYHSKSKHNAYKGYDAHRRKIELKKAIFAGDTTGYERAIKKCLTAFEKFQKEAAPSLAFLDDVEFGLLKMREYFTSVDWEERTKSGGMVHKPGDIAAGVRQAAAMLKSVKELRETVHVELEDHERQTKKNREIGHYER